MATKKTTGLSLKNIPRDCTTISPWQQGPFTLPLPTTVHQEPEETVYNTLIIGGGITGIITALLLQKEGKKCILVEAGCIGYGTTGGTSAHLNTFFDASYPEIEKDFGEDAAKLVAKSGKEAFALIAELVKDLSINCDLEYKKAFLFSENDKESKELDEIYTSSKKAGISVIKASEIDVPVPFQNALLFKDQGQFHPIKYIHKLAQAFVKAGGVVFENVLIRKASMQDEIHVAESDNMKVMAKNLVYATHIPPGINLLHFRCAPYRSYVLGISLKDNAYPAGLAYDMQEPYHYFRTHVINGKKQLILGGEDHKTGHEDPEKAFEKLEAYARKYYNIASIDFRWSAQYYVPSDGLPYIGHMPGGNKHTFVATGYNGNGMMFGTIAAKIIRDIICGRKNSYTDLFKPSRIKPVAGFQDFLKENTDVVYHFIADRFSADEIDSIKSIPKDSGNIVDYKNQKLAVYKDTDGIIYALNPVCTHAKCIVNFNHIEKSWDCPCHGGRFDINGKVLTGPPRQNLQKIQIQ